MHCFRYCRSVIGDEPDAVFMQIQLQHLRYLHNGKLQIERIINDD